MSEVGVQTDGVVEGQVEVGLRLNVCPIRREGRLLERSLLVLDLERLVCSSVLAEGAFGAVRPDSLFRGPGIKKKLVQLAALQTL